MSGSATNNNSTFRLLITQGTTSGSTPPSPGGNGRTPTTITAGASATLTVYFAIRGTQMRTDAKQLSAELQPFVLSSQEPVNGDYYLIANITEPQSGDVA